MSEHFPALILLAPLFGALVIGLFGLRDHRVCLPATLSALAVSLFAAIALARQVATGGPVDYFMAGWEEPLGIGIQLRADAINSLLLIVIAVVSLLAAVFTIRPAGERDTEKTPYFYILFLLLAVGLFGITIAGDAFNVFVLIEVTALSSYGLVAIGSSKRCKVAAFHYLIMGTVGASFYLLGVGYLYLKLGSLNMQDIHRILDADGTLHDTRAIRTAFVFILVGIWTKMALFPLHGWLPNAYSYSPSGSAAILAPLVTKVSVYVMVRMMVSVFGLDRLEMNVDWGHLVVWLAVIAIVAGSMMALAQREVKKMLCCLIIAEVGYMVGGAWLGDPGRWGITGTLYHILADALMTSCLFLAAGAFAKWLGVVKLDDLSGLFRKMPLAATGFVIGGLAIIGVPPTCGFYSKFYLIRGGIESGQWFYVAALIGSSLVNAVLFFRIFEIAYFGKNPVASHAHGHGSDDHGPHDHTHDEAPVVRREPPLHALVPVLIAAALLVLLGIFNGPIVEFIRTGLIETAKVVSNG
ncbi:MAG: monovalent cation/H+ antiporter subunit D family protein [Verrucomicrobiales bacterium]|nr:monovalent cation/H+ antiporter subunit D family protein [Verrucomicrobiales bacterium]